MNENELVIVIPAYEPNKLMIDLLKDLNENFKDFLIVIVNDGSKEVEIFDKASLFDNVTILTHNTNKGKGEALKTAFRYINGLEGHHIIVTCDADGQHKVSDIKKVVDYYKIVNDGLVLGSRVFDKPIPFRSKFGNDVTKIIYKLSLKQSLNDNQTGLRAFGSELLDKLIKIEGSKYEYEMNMLLELSRKSINIHEVAIEAIYIDNNSSSHFRPVRDFIRICKEMFKYFLPILITLVINVLAFLLCYNFLFINEYEASLHILYSGLVSCSFASICNLIINYFGVCYGNNYLVNNKKKRRRFLLAGIGATLVNAFSIYGIFLLVKDVAGAKSLGDVTLIIITMLLDFLFVPKAKLH